MIEQLRLRVRPMVGEPAHSIAARLATRHEAPLMPFLRSLNFCLRDLARGRHLDRFAALASLELDTLRAANARATGIGQGVRLGNEDLSWVDWTITPRRVCPACLFEDRASSLADVGWAAWHRSWWDVRAVQLCPIHGCGLRDRCGTCGEGLDWDALAIDRCRLGHDLAQSASDPLDTTVDRYLYERLFPTPFSPPIPFLNQLALGNAAKVVERLGAIGRDGWSEHLKHHDQYRRRLAGFEIASDIERLFPAALDKVLARAPYGPSGLVGNYGWIYRSWLGVPDADQSGGRLLAILLRHAAKNQIISGHELESASDRVSLKAIAATLGKAQASAKAIVSSAGLVPAGSRRGVAFHIASEELERLRRRLVTLIDCQTAARLLGIGRAQFRSLVGAKLVSADDEAAKLGCGQLFDPERLNEFCHDLTTDLVILHTAPWGALPLPVACRDASVPLWKVCRAILEGRLRPIARSRQVAGLGGIWVATAELSALAAPRPRPVAVVSKALGIHPQAASELIKAGAFGDPPDLSAASLDAFAREYAKPADLAGLLGRSGRSVILKLTKANLEPAFGPPRCRQVFYSRSVALARLTARSTSQQVH